LVDVSNTIFFAIDHNQSILETLPPVEQHGSVVVFAKEIVPQQTGRMGYALRITTNHYGDPLTRPCGALMKRGR
jgi:starch phosphorylase